MNHIISLAFCTILISNVNKPSNDFDLDSYRWENRLVLLFTEEVPNEKFDAQILDLFKDKAGLLDRQMRIFKISNGLEIEELVENEKFSMDKNLRTKLNIPENEFYIVLIGKDGTIKYKDSNPVSREKLFAIIDAMPMRQAEMNRKPEKDKKSYRQ